MPHRAFVFELVAGGDSHSVGAGAICPERKELAVWRVGCPVEAARRVAPGEWAPLRNQLDSSLPTGDLPSSSAVAAAFVGDTERAEVRVRYLGVFPLDAARTLPETHPAGRVLQSWARPRGVG